MSASAEERDAGFTLIETITSVVVIGIVMMALTSFFITTVSTVNAQGGAQAATALAESAIARVRSMKGSTLLTGRDPASTLAQWLSPAPGAATWLAATSQVADLTALTDAGLSAALPTTPLSVLVNSITYEQNFYVGTCWQPVGGGDCTASVTTGVPFYRVVVAVTWPGRGCGPARCSYVTATLVSSAPGDPVFNVSKAAKQPQILNPGNQAGTIGTAVSVQLTATGGAKPLIWSFSGLPAGLAGTSAGLISGTLPGTAGSYAVKVSVKDAFNLSGTAVFTWIVYAAPPILSSARVEVWLDSSDTTRVLTAAGTPAAAGDRVATIKDRSGNNRHVTQATVANQMSVGTLNGHQAVASTATTWLTSALTGAFRTVVAVAAPSLTTPLQTVFAAPANTDKSLRLSNGRVGGNAAGDIDANDWSVGGQNWTNDVVAVAPMPTAPAIYVAEAAATASGKTFSLSSSFLSRGLVGSIGEVIVFNTTLTAAERRTVEDYLASKWSVAMAPGAPSAVNVAPADSAGVVSWTAPATGNSPIAGYTVTATPTDLSLPAASCTAATTPTSCSLSNLVNGAPYTVTVTAINAVGEGPASAGTELIAYPSALLAAGNLGTWLDASATGKVLTAGGMAATTGQSVQTWNDRSGNNRNAVQATTAYQMTVGTLNGRQALTSTATTRYNSTANGSFRTIITVGAPNTSLTYNTTFAAPANTDFSQRIVSGYLPIVGGPYPTNANDWSNGTGTPTHVWINSLASPGTVLTPGIFISESASTITNSFSVSTGFTISGSTRGFNGPLGEVIAINRILTSTERRQVEEYLARKWSIAVTPQAPTIVAVTKPATKQLTVTWTAPAWNGGSAVTGYTATAAVGKSCAAAAGVYSCTISGLTAATTYPVTVTATNAVGAGAASVAVNGTA